MVSGWGGNFTFPFALLFQLFFPWRTASASLVGCQGAPGYLPGQSPTVSVCPLSLYGDEIERKFLISNRIQLVISVSERESWISSRCLKALLLFSCFLVLTLNYLFDGGFFWFCQPLLDWLMMSWSFCMLSCSTEQQRHASDVLAASQSITNII